MSQEMPENSEVGWEAPLSNLKIMLRCFTLLYSRRIAIHSIWAFDGARSHVGPPIRDNPAVTRPKYRLLHNQIEMVENIELESATRTVPASPRL